ncbi:MAG: heparan-alpha-glucosaminide N-acetyltransferase domain-containing protein [Candidatus Bathyarchaeota archaeon]|nr:heparan-alpha-glucosaminide N-acetyltransferase domain-containing protein [Candidatus Bathyarchaeota archaeon]
MASAGNTVRKSTGRLDFIDFARGLVMIIMAWDHVSGFWNRFHHGGEGVMGFAPGFLNTTWFLARFVSHYCAPTFIFLAGTVLALSTIKRVGRGESEISVTSRMIIRGLVLLVLEVLVVSPAFVTPWLYFGVIACIGACFIIFSVARKLPLSVILVSSLLIILNHNFLKLDFIPANVWWGWYLRVIIHEPNFVWEPYVGLYPIIPWIGVMGLGWVLGSLISGYTSEQVKELREPLKKIGLASIAMFIVVRGVNSYGNLLPRQGWSLVDWLYVSKYPPSVAFLLWTLGGMCLFLSYGLRLQDKLRLKEGVTGAILLFGRTPLFFYLTHLWLYRLRLPGVRSPPFFMPMMPTLGLWVVGLLALNQLCKRYEKVKRANPGSILQYI